MTHLQLSQNPLDRLPDWTLLTIFSYLPASSVIHASAVCHRWLRLSRDEQLWKRRFKIDFPYGNADHTKIDSWLFEYRRFTDECPRVPVKTLTKHKEHVLHVSFSKDGSMLVTCSKDGTLKIWKAEGDWPLIHDKNLRQLLYWKYTLCARFNQSDKLILVSGLRAGETAATVPQNGIAGAGPNGAVGLGELAVFEFVKKAPRKDDCTGDDAQILSPDQDLVFRCRAINEPFDVYGCWFDNESILNGQSRRFNQTSTMSDLYFLHAASEQTTSTRLFQFYNATGGVARNLLVSSYVRHPDREDDPVMTQKDKLLVFTTGYRMDTPHQIGVKLVRNERITGPLEAAAKTLKMRIENPPPHPGFRKIQDIKKIEAKSSPVKTTDAGIIGKIFEKCKISENGQEAKNGIEKVDGENQGSSSCTEESKTESKTEGAQTQTLENENQEEAPSTSGVTKGNVQKEKEESEEEEEESDDEDASPLQQVQIRVHTFDRVDHIIETYGRIMGMTISPDHRYVFVHVRPFVDPHYILDLAPDQPIPVHDHMEIRIIDLQSLALLDDSFLSNGDQSIRQTSENSNTNFPAFFLDLDANDQYVLSGGHGSDAYLWDRQHRCLIRSLPHDQGRVVNSVAFNPQDSHVCVSAADDGSVTVWYSKAKQRDERLIHI